MKKAGEFTSSVTIAKGDKSADAKRIFGVMGLGVKTGEEVTITADGAHRLCRPFGTHCF